MMDIFFSIQNELAKLTSIGQSVVIYYNLLVEVSGCFVKIAELFVSFYGMFSSLQIWDIFW